MAYSEEKIQEIFKAICDRIEEGESLRSVLRDNKMPSSQTFFKWIDSDQIKSKQYARATTLRADAIFDDMLDIADDGTNDYVQKLQGEQMVDVLNSEHVQRSRLRIDARKWALAKMNPKKYGDKLDVMQTVSDKRKSVNDLFPSENELDEED